MLGELNEKQIEALLKRQITGRLGCHADGVTYVVPVNYFYRSPNIFAHSANGLKVAMMRKNPEVCFQVDDIHDIFRWECVIAWGTFVEITDRDEKQQAMQGLIHRIMPLVNQPSGHPSHAITTNEDDMDTTIENIVYKIVLSKKTGRFETDYDP